MTKKKINKRAFLIATLRKASYRWHTRTEALRNARIGRNQYKCASCTNIFTKSQIHLDHVNPVVDIIKGFTTLDEFAERLLPDDASGFQVLCIACHEIKTSAENEMRKKFKKLKKEEEK